jgi:hypothetical protein
MKRILALLLVVVIAATALNIPALAYSMNEDGYYKGKYYSGTINCVHSYATATLRWNDTRYPLTVKTLFIFKYDDNPNVRIPNPQSKTGYRAVSDINHVEGNRDQTAVCAYLDGYIGQVPIIDGLCSWAPALPKS